jgi:DNA-binding HxlR family transcriptional regulator
VHRVQVDAARAGPRAERGEPAGAIERATPGLTAKVLTERLVKLVAFGILSKQSYPEIPPRVEYTLTPFGERFVAILDQIEQLKAEYGG